METLALFDFDGTLIRGDSIVPYLCRAHAQGDASLGDLMAAATGYFLFRLHLRTAEEAKTRALQFRRRLSPARRDALDGGFAREYLLPRLYPAGKECLLAHAQAGRRVALVSASPDNYMRYVAAALGVDLICTRILPDGCADVNCSGQEKVRRLRAYVAQHAWTVDWQASYAYGDSRSDMPMLRLCGHGYAVNPKRALRKAMRAENTLCWRQEPAPRREDSP